MMRKQNRIVLVGGLAGSGKGEVAKILVDRFGFTERSFADPMREMALGINPIIDWNEHGPIRYRDLIETIGYRETKDLYPEARAFLQRLGTEGIREILGPDVWVNYMVEHLPLGPVVIPDVRFINELEMPERYAGLHGVSVWVDRPGVVAPNTHISEATLRPEWFDYRINNNGTLVDLADSVLDLAQCIGLDG